MAERLKAHAWKACWGQPLRGSNPRLSAKVLLIMQIILSANFISIIKLKGSSPSLRITLSYMSISGISVLFSQCQFLSLARRRSHPPPPPPTAGIPLDGGKNWLESQRMVIPHFQYHLSFHFYPKVSESIAAEYELCRQMEIMLIHFCLYVWFYS